MKERFYNRSEKERKFVTDFNSILNKTDPRDEVEISLWKWEIEYLTSRGIIVAVSKTNKGLFGLFERKRWVFADGSRPNTRIKERQYESYVW